MPHFRPPDSPPWRDGDPAKHIVVRETCYQLSGDGGVSHLRAPAFMDIPNDLDRRFATPMVRYGSQAGFSGYTEDDVGVFVPISGAGPPAKGT